MRYEHLKPDLIQFLRLLTVVELAAVSVRTVIVLVEVLALFGAVVRVDVVFLLQLVVPVRERALGPKFAFAHLPVAADLSLELLLEIRGRGASLFGLDCLDLVVNERVLFVVLVLG